MSDSPSSAGTPAQSRLTSLELSTVAPVPLIDLTGQYAQIASEVQEAVAPIFQTQHFVLGEEVEDFETEIARYTDSAFAIGCGSGTDALLLALMALDIGPGDEVITTPFSFFATASTIHRVGARAVFVDIEPHGFNLDPDAVEAAVTPRTKAILPVHLFGQTANMEPLWRVAVRSGLPIIEDACQAIGADYRGRRAGVLGTIGCFSFFPTKNLGGAGDGGCMTTDDEDLARRLSSLRVHGQSSTYHHQEVGINSRLDALQAAVLRVKLRHLDRWTTARQQNAARYDRLFRHYQLLDAVELPRVLPETRHVFNQYTIRFRSDQRDSIRQSLQEAQIGSGIYYPLPLHLQPCFSEWGYQSGDFPRCEQAARDCLSLPIFAELSADQQERVVRQMAVALGRTLAEPLFQSSSQAA